MLSRVKVIAYQTLIRPILSYGCPMWYNISASLMEKIRIYERKCLRACLGKYRKATTGYKHFISNKNIYNWTKIIRIDNFLISLIRKHFSRVSLVENNSLVCHSIYPSETYIQKAMQTGFIPPEGFIFLDKNGYLQNENNLPVIYHIKRRATNKKITINVDNQAHNATIYNTNISIQDTNKKKPSCWWLQE